MQLQKEGHMKGRQIRQGDVFLKPIACIPVGAKPRKEKERIVLAYGEVTGHAHAIHDLGNVDVLVAESGAVYLRVKESVGLQHEEHGRIAVLPGNYQVVIQREYSPKEIRNVVD